jgi:hypothetical protein
MYKGIKPRHVRKTQLFCETRSVPWCIIRFEGAKQRARNRRGFKKSFCHASSCLCRRPKISTGKMLHSCYQLSRNDSLNACFACGALPFAGLLCRHSEAATPDIQGARPGIAATALCRRVAEGEQQRRKRLDRARRLQLFTFHRSPITRN